MVDVKLIDVDLVDGAIVPVRLRERIRAAGPTNRTDLGKQARPPEKTEASWVNLDPTEDEDVPLR